MRSSAMPSFVGSSAEVSPREFLHEFFSCVLLVKLSTCVFLKGSFACALSQRPCGASIRGCLSYVHPSERHIFGLFYKRFFLAPLRMGLSRALFRRECFRALLCVVFLVRFFAGVFLWAPPQGLFYAIFRRGVRALLRRGFPVLSSTDTISVRSFTGCLFENSSCRNAFPFALRQGLPP